MTTKKALKVWHDSVGFNEIECRRDLQESIMIAFRSLEAWDKVKEETKRMRDIYSNCGQVDIASGLSRAMDIIDKYREVSE